MPESARGGANSRSPFRATLAGNGQSKQSINIKVNMTGEADNEEDVKNMGKRLVEVQMQNIELEQDMAILRKKFRDLLAYKGLGNGEGASLAQK